MPSLYNENRMSVYAGPPMRRALETGNRENRSQRLNAVCSRYLTIVTAELARLNFTESEWCAIVDVNDTVVGSDSAWLTTFANVLDADGLDEKWGIDREALGRRMQALSVAGRAAVADVIEGCWTAPDASAGILDAKLLREAGAIIPEAEDAA